MQSSLGKLDEKGAEEWAKMMRGERYEAFYPAFGDLLVKGRKLVREFNDAAPDDFDRLHDILSRMLGTKGRNLIVNQPFRCDYGCNIHVGDNCIFNFNLTILDEGKVTIGNNVFIGPNVSLYTACHPLQPADRNKGIEWALPITIGNDVWIGGSVTILPGVEIGEGTTIGAGSVVTKSMPAHCVAAGNPCRVIKKLDV